ncbi:MAG: hypothetical protein DRH56_08900 [Deltaproteobacteria bacterium]|nr:MAG: hypothetical protein DRH56_08900 [Deltaproteobacteria bacterium]
MVALLFSSLVNVVLFFRVIEIGYYEPFDAAHGEDAAGLVMAEAPLAMVVPLLLVAAGLVLVGLYTGDIVVHVVNPSIPKAIL